MEVADTECHLYPLKFLQEFIISRFVEPELLTVKKIVKDVALTIEASCTCI